MKAGHLFDGAGGMRLGFEQAGIETEWTRDILHGQDITQENSNSDYARVGLITGGPPCQKTSRAAAFAKRKTNFTLWPHMLRCTQEIKPTWVVVEQPASVDKEIILGWCSELQQCGYGIAGRIIDSKHWLPQQRARWFIVGRLEVNGLALWNYLYGSSDGMEGIRESVSRYKFFGNCPDCLRGGIFARVSARIPALVGAGNAVSVPVARFIGERIIEAEREIERAKEHFGETK